MFGLYKDYVTAMKEILKLNPKSEMADVLLMRAVNIEEEKFNGSLGNDISKQKELIEKIKLKKKNEPIAKEISINDMNVRLLVLNSSINKFGVANIKL